MILKRKSSGMILITVLAVVIVMSVLASALLSQHLSHAVSAQDRVDQIKAQELAQGAFWLAYEQMNAGVAISVSTETLDGKVFTPTMGAKPVPPATAYTVTVAYP